MNAANDNMTGKLVYVALRSLPGCLPEMEPMAFNTFAEAKEAIREELSRQFDIACDDAQETKSREFWQCLVELSEKTACFTISAPDGYHYEVTTDYWEIEELGE